MNNTKKVFLLIFLSLALQLVAQISLNELKAAYIGKFTKFIEWPDSTESNKQSFIIGYYELNDFIDVLQLSLGSSSIQGKLVEFQHIKSTEDAMNCDLIYLPDLSIKEQKRIYTYLSSEPILTIGHTEDYARNGVHINFYLKDGKLKFEINPESLKRSGLKSSYLLLKLAKIVEFEGGNV